MKVYKITYNISDVKNNVMQIFTYDFIDSYRNYCIMVYKNKKYNLMPIFGIRDNKSDELRIKLISFVDLPDIDIITNGKGILYGYFEETKLNKKTHKPGVIVKYSYYDVCLLVYQVNPSEKRIKIFGEDFVKNNKDKYKLLYNHELYELTEYFSIKNNEVDYFYITLIGLEQYSDKS